MGYKFPSIKAVSAVLRNVKLRQLDESWEMKVRLQVYEDGQWVVRTGDSSYDEDHRGWWGWGYVNIESNCRDLARDLLEQVKDEQAMQSSYNPNDGTK